MVGIAYDPANLSNLWEIDVGRKRCLDLQQPQVSSQPEENGAPTTETCGIAHFPRHS
jgi:hypothetical protein